jgi:uncharacterized membrane protein
VGSSITRSLIKLAVAWLPQGQRERFGEEWQSHVDEVPGKIGKLLCCVGFLFAAYNMALITRRNQKAVEALLDEYLFKIVATTLAMVGIYMRRVSRLWPMKDLTSLLLDLGSQINETVQTSHRLLAATAAFGAPSTLSYAIKRRGQSLLLRQMKIVFKLLRET